MTQLTDEQIKLEDEFLKGLPRFNVAAFLMPPIWGPAHGFWITILYYPAWLVSDNLIYEAYANPSPLSIIAASTCSLILLAVTVAFAIVSQPIAAHRAEAKGVSRDVYLRHQRIWTVVSAVIAIVMLGLATYYNTQYRADMISPL